MLITMLNAGFLHNTITVDGVDEFYHLDGLLETKKPLDNVWEHTPEYTLFAGEFDFRPLKPIRWQRRILFVPAFGWLLQDVLTGELETAQIEQNFQFDDNIQVALDGAIAVATAPNGARLLCGRWKVRSRLRSPSEIKHRVPLVPPPTALFDR